MYGLESARRKPPLGLWIEAIFVFLGVNGFAVGLPNILTGLVNIVVIYHIVRKRYGAGAGLIVAALGPRCCTSVVFRDEQSLDPIEALRQE
jgi:hypothetical protein